MKGSIGFQEDLNVGKQLLRTLHSMCMTHVSTKEFRIAPFWFPGSYKVQVLDVVCLLGICSTSTGSSFGAFGALCQVKLVRRGQKNSSPIELFPWIHFFFLVRVRLNKNTTSRKKNSSRFKIQSHEICSGFHWCVFLSPFLHCRETSNSCW